MSLGKPTPELLIFKKSKMWWELMHEIHLPDRRILLSEQELISIAEELVRLEKEVRHIQVANNFPLKKMIDFCKLRKVFFREKKYIYGVPVKEVKKNV